jgi:hypothetical protein
MSDNRYLGPLDIHLNDVYVKVLVTVQQYLVPLVLLKLAALQMVVGGEAGAYAISFLDFRAF